MFDLQLSIKKVKDLLQNSQPRFSVGVVGVLLILAGLWAYTNYYNSANQTADESVSVQTNRESLGSISGGAIGPNGIAQTEGTVAGASTAKTAESKDTVKSAAKWQARQIERNTIKDSTYKVQQGDTLWQIAQGKYGSGFEWTKILAANKDKIGFLPNGSQALIEIGQELTLP